MPVRQYHDPETAVLHYAAQKGKSLNIKQARVQW